MDNHKFSSPLTESDSVSRRRISFNPGAMATAPTRNCRNSGESERFCYLSPSSEYLREYDTDVFNGKTALQNSCLGFGNSMIPNGSNHPLRGRDAAFESLHLGERDYLAKQGLRVTPNLPIGESLVGASMEEFKRCTKMVGASGNKNVGRGSTNRAEKGMRLKSLPKDVRVESIDQFVKTKLCPYMNKPEGCMRHRSNVCPYAHSDVELRPMPNLNKTAMCRLFLKGMCSKGADQCGFAHNLQDLRCTRGFFKTEICRFWKQGHCRAGNTCRHAHGEEELRSKSAPFPKHSVPDVCASANLASSSVVSESYEYSQIESNAERDYPKVKPQQKSDHTGLSTSTRTASTEQLDTSNVLTDSGLPPCLPERIEAPSEMDIAPSSGANKSFDSLPSPSNSLTSFRSLRCDDVNLDSIQVSPQRCDREVLDSKSITAVPILEGQNASTTSSVICTSPESNSPDLSEDCSKLSGSPPVVILPIQYSEEVGEQGKTTEIHLYDFMVPQSSDPEGQGPTPAPNSIHDEAKSVAAVPSYHATDPISDYSISTPELAEVSTFPSASPYSVHESLASNMGNYCQYWDPMLQGNSIVGYHQPFLNYPPSLTSHDMSISTSVGGAFPCGNNFPYWGSSHVSGYGTSVYHCNGAYYQMPGNHQAQAFEWPSAPNMWAIPTVYYPPYDPSFPTPWTLLAHNRGIDPSAGNPTAANLDAHHRVSTSSMHIQPSPTSFTPLAGAEAGVCGETPLMCESLKLCDEDIEAMEAHLGQYHQVLMGESGSYGSPPSSESFSRHTDETITAQIPSAIPFMPLAMTLPLCGSSMNSGTTLTPTPGDISEGMHVSDPQNTCATIRNYPSTLEAMSAPYCCVEAKSSGSSGVPPQEDGNRCPEFAHVSNGTHSTMRNPKKDSDHPTIPVRPFGSLFSLQNPFGISSVVSTNVASDSHTRNTLYGPRHSASDGLTNACHQEIECEPYHEVNCNGPVSEPYRAYLTEGCLSPSFAEMQPPYHHQWRRSYASTTTGGPRSCSPSVSPDRGVMSLSVSDSVSEGTSQCSIPSRHASPLLGGEDCREEPREETANPLSLKIYVSGVPGTNDVQLPTSSQEDYVFSSLRDAPAGPVGGRDCGSACVTCRAEKLPIAHLLGLMKPVAEAISSLPSPLYED